jgi:Domain of unknown function (DUF4349)
LAGKSRSGGRIGKAGIFVCASFWSWKQWAVGIGAAAVLLLFLALTTPRLDRYAVTVNKAPVAVQRTAAQAENSGDTSKSTLGMLEAGRNRIFEQTGEASPTAPWPPPLSAPVTHNSTLFAADSSGMAHGIKDNGQSIIASAPMIARTVSLAIVTKNFVASRASLDAILGRRHGYAAQLTVSNAENAPRTLQASLRIPAAELSLAAADLRTLGRVENESQSGEEVTQQHVDLVARLKNSHETEQRLQAILAQRPGKMSDVLEVEQEIARVRGEIEGMEAEQKNLEHRVEFATVNLQLTEEYKAQLNPPASSISTRIHNAVVAGYRDASETILGFVLFFAESGPTLLIWLVIIPVPIWALWRRYRRSLAAIGGGS